MKLDTFTEYSRKRATLGLSFLSNFHTDPIGRCHLDDLVHGLLDAVSSVPADHECGAPQLVAHRRQGALQEVLHIVGRAQELLHLLPEAGGARLLAREGARGHARGGGHLLKRSERGQWSE